jgi:hypothetical protein
MMDVDIELYIPRCFVLEFAKGVGVGLEVEALRKE